MEFVTSTKELLRRKKAFVALLLSMFAGILLFSYLFGVSMPVIYFVIIGILFLIFYVATARYLDSLSKVRLSISHTNIERHKGKDTEKYSIKEIKSIKIKRRTSGNIREMYLYFNNNRQLNMNAFEEKFEILKDAILDKTNSSMPLKEVREPIYFDHLFFYPILGLAISSFSISLLKFVVKTDYRSIGTAELIFSLYIFALALYFLIKKPIATGSGKDQIVADYVFGIIMLLAGIIIAAIGWFTLH